MSDARNEVRTGNATVLSGASAVNIRFASAMPDANYEVMLQPKQVGTYSAWVTMHETTGFTLNISPAASGNVVFSYTANSKSDDSGDSLVMSLAPELWLRYGLGITEAGGFVSQWDDQSGNARHAVQAVATNQPSLEADNSILFAIDNNLKCATFPLVQPSTVYALLRNVTWVLSAVLFDGNADAAGAVQNVVATPQIYLNAGTQVAGNSGLTVNEYAAMVAVFNGGSSLLRVMAGAQTTGNPGAGNMNGFTLGRAGSSVSNYANIQVKEIIVYATAHDAFTRSAIIEYLCAVGELTL